MRGCCRQPLYSHDGIFPTGYIEWRAGKSSTRTNSAGGDKTGDDRWYEAYVPRADRLYDEHLAALRKEGWSEDG